MRVWFNGRMSASQAEYAGSIPVTRFNSGVDKMRNDVITKGGSDKPEQDGKNMMIDEDVIFDCECDFDVFDDVVDDVVCEDD